MTPIYALLTLALLGIPALVALDRWDERLRGGR